MKLTLNTYYVHGILQLRKKTFILKIILDLQKSCKESGEDSCFVP